MTLIVSGFGFAMFSSPNTSAIMGSVDKQYYGVASGILATMHMTGQTLSMAIAMLFFSLFIGRVQLSPHYYPAFFTFLCILGVFASLVRGEKGSLYP
jgi:hypothetical protein